MFVGLAVAVMLSYRFFLGGFTVKQLKHSKLSAYQLKHIAKNIKTEEKIKT